MRRGRLAAIGLGAASALLSSGAIARAATLSRISNDPFSSPTVGQHKTEVEPDSFAFGNTIVSVMQQGRIFGGGAADIGFATSPRNGRSWNTGSFSGITRAGGGGTFDAVSDPSVAYDAKHDVWMATGLALAGGLGAAVTLNRSTNGGLSWDSATTPLVASGKSDLDKEWIVCDNHASSPHYGNCYIEVDDFGNQLRILMLTSSDGGLTWGAPTATADTASGLGGQPVVQPNGNVVVPIADSNINRLFSFVSTDGGASFGPAATIANAHFHPTAGGVRSDPLPSAEVDGAGRVYVVWSDCRFRTGCKENDIVLSTSTDGTSWSAPARVPLDPVDGTVDHFIPGIAVDPASSGSNARIGLSYYFYPDTKCTSATCDLSIGFASSADGGASWSSPTTLQSGMRTSWLAATSQGRMVGDYISTSFAGDGDAHPFVINANAPSGSVFDEGLATTSLPVTASAVAKPASTRHVVVTGPAPRRGPHTVR